MINLIKYSAFLIVFILMTGCQTTSNKVVLKDDDQSVSEQVALSELANKIDALAKVNKELYSLREKHGIKQDGDAFTIVIPGELNGAERTEEYRLWTKKVIFEIEKVNLELAKLEKIN